MWMTKATMASMAEHTRLSESANEKVLSFLLDQINVSSLAAFVLVCERQLANRVNFHADVAMVLSIDDVSRLTDFFARFAIVQGR